MGGRVTCDRALGKDETGKNFVGVDEGGLGGWVGGWVV